MGADGVAEIGHPRRPAVTRTAGARPAGARPTAEDAAGQRCVQLRHGQHRVGGQARRDVPEPVRDRQVVATGTTTLGLRATGQRRERNLRVIRDGLRAPSPGPLSGV